MQEATTSKDSNRSPGGLRCPRRFAPGVSRGRAGACLALLLAVRLAGQGGDEQVDALAELDALFAKHVATTDVPGISVGIVRNGRLVLAKGYGKRSLKPSRPVESDTVFAIGSVTKQFTCACVLQLAEAGKLSVRDKVSRYFPDLQRADDIMLLDLMNHTSGYPDYYPLDFVHRRMAQPIAAAELIRQFAGPDAHLDFEPGTRYSYSNTGYILLGEIVAKVTGKPFGTVLRERIFEPLEMKHTHYDPDPKRAGIARGYSTFALGPPEPNTPEGKGWVGAAGAIYSTPGDLAKWYIALMAGKVVTAESFAVMTRSRRLRDGNLTGYGCGLAVGSRGKREVLSHGGATNGFRAWTGMIPSMRAAVILLSNRDGGLGALPAQSLDILLRDPPKTTPAPVPAIAGPPADAVVRRVFGMLQRGKVDDALLTEDFDHYLTPRRVAGAAQRLAKLGTPVSVQVTSRRERGAMEVTWTLLTFENAKVRVLMYRQQNGKIAQFFVRR